MALLGPVKSIARQTISAARALTAPCRALPDFIIVGAQKSGTTSLYKYLCEHPDVLPATNKQLHFFDYNFQNGVSWYRAQFPMRVRQWVAGSRRLVTGEATPNYLVHPHAAARCKQTLPDARLIFILRNPIERAYSHYHHCVRDGLEQDTKTFEEALDLEEKRLEGEAEKMLQDETYRSEALMHFSYVRRSEYIRDIERWLELYPREQVHFLSTEELLTDGQGQFDGIIEFLGISPFTRANWHKENVGSYNDKISATTRKRLMEHFRPFNDRLFELVGRRFPWDE